MAPDRRRAGRQTSSFDREWIVLTLLETFSKICLEAVRECGPGSDVAAIEKAILRRVDALPIDERRALECAVKALASYEPPGFHEHGSH